MLEILVIANIIAYRTSDLQHVLFLCKYLANAVFSAHISNDIFTIIVIP